MVEQIHIDTLIEFFPQCLLNTSPKTYSQYYDVDPSAAFLDALCGGPWRRERQNTVRKQVREWYEAKGVKDLRDLVLHDVKIDNPYPLAWQKKVLYSVITNTKISHYTFNEKVQQWRTDPNTQKSIAEFFEYCGVGQNGSKITWVYVRDCLALDGFPIDRWVRRGLKHFKLPQNPHYIIEVCNKAGINVAAFNAEIKNFAKANNLKG